MAQQINLYNPVFLQKKKYFSAVTMLQALALLLGGILLFYGYAAHQSRTLGKLAVEGAKQLETNSAQVTQLTREFSAQGTSRMLEDELARATTRLKEREDLLGVLRTGGLGNTDGFAKYLGALARQSVPGVWLTGLSIGGDESDLRLNGRVLHSDLVPAYIRVLNKEEVMRGRRIAEMRLTAREEAVSPVTAAPGTSAGPAAEPPAQPLKYIEFAISAVRGQGGAVAQAPAAKESAK